MHIDSYLRKHALYDITQVWYNGGEKTYEYFQLSDYIKEKIKNYGDKDTLLEEWITLDSQAVEITRTVQDLSDVFGKIGGI